MRSRFAEMNCSVARSLDVFGDRWTLLIIREAFFGTRRFADFEARLGISKNILSSRLKHLVDHGVLETVDAGNYGHRLEYQLGAAGKDLLTVITALRQWGDRWIFGAGAEPLAVHDRHTGRAIPRLRIADDDGKPIAGGDLIVGPGLGATEETRERFASPTGSGRPT